MSPKHVDSGYFQRNFPIMPVCTTICDGVLYHADGTGQRYEGPDLHGHPAKRVETCEVRAAGDRSLTFIASTERVARDGDIIEVAGWDTKEFMRNPVFLWAHDNHTPPIGRVTKTRKVRGKGEDRRLEIDVDFAGAEQNHELADTVFRLFKGGFMNAVSVGFSVKGHRSPDDEERAKLGLGPFGHVITAAELLEVSAVPVPADPGAVLTGAREEDLVRMRDAVSAEQRPAWEKLTHKKGECEPNCDHCRFDRDMAGETNVTSGHVDVVGSTTWVVPPDTSKQISALGAEILERIDTNFREIRNVLRLRDVPPEEVAEAPRDEASTAERFAEDLVRRLAQREDNSHG